MIRASIIAGVALLLVQARAQAGQPGASSSLDGRDADAAQVRYLESPGPRELGKTSSGLPSEAAAPAITETQLRAPLIGGELLSLLISPVFPPRGATLEDGAHFLPVVAADIAPDRSSKLRLVSYNESAVATIGNERPWTAPAPRKALPLAA